MLKYSQLNLITEAKKKSKKDDPEHYDMVVVGGGPAGLTAAMHGASENLKVAVLDASHKFGGQALSSRAIENYPGFPNGISGKRLLGHFVSQANKFRTNLVPNAMAANLETDKNGKHVITTTDGRKFSSHSIVLSPGLHYNTVPELDKYLGKGVHYGLPDRMEHKLAKQEGYSDSRHVVIIGGGNSGGQAADRLRKIKGLHVHLVSRGDVQDSMSDYLVQRLANSKNVTIHNKTSINACHGNGSKLTHLSLDNGKTIPTNHAVVYAGAKPRTDWLRGKVEMDENGYIKTGSHVESKKPITEISKRPRLPLETSIEGVFAAGDVRHKSTKRVVASSGEGGSALQSIHAHRDMHPVVQKEMSKPENKFFFHHEASKPIDKKAPKLPSRVRKAKPPKPRMHPQDGMRERAKIAARVLSSLSKAKPTERKKAKTLKETVEWTIQ